MYNSIRYFEVWLVQECNSILNYHSFRSVTAYWTITCSGVWQHTELSLAQECDIILNYHSLRSVIAYWIITRSGVWQRTELSLVQECDSILNYHSFRSVTAYWTITCSGVWLILESEGFWNVTGSTVHLLLKFSCVWLLVFRGSRTSVFMPPREESRCVYLGRWLNYYCRPRLPSHEAITILKWLFLYALTASIETHNGLRRRFQC